MNSKKEQTVAEGHVEKWLRYLKLLGQCIPAVVAIGFGLGFSLLFFYRYQASSQINIWAYIESTDYLTIAGILSLIIGILAAPHILYAREEKMRADTQASGPLRTVDAILSRLPASAVLALYLPLLIFMEYALTQQYNRPFRLYMLSIWIGVNLVPLIVWFMNKPRQSPLSAAKIRVVPYMYLANLMGAVLLLVFQPTRCIQISGYGHKWGSLILKPEHGDFLSKHPDFQNLIRKEKDGFWYSTEEIFIFLDLKTHIIVSPSRPDEKTNVSFVPIPKDGVYIFQRTKKSEKDSHKK